MATDLKTLFTGKYKMWWIGGGLGVAALAFFTRNRSTEVSVDDIPPTLYEPSQETAGDSVSDQNPDYVTRSDLGALISAITGAMNQKPPQVIPAIPTNTDLSPINDMEGLLQLRDGEGYDNPFDFGSPPALSTPSVAPTINFANEKKYLDNTIKEAKATGNKGLETWATTQKAAVNQQQYLTETQAKAKSSGNKGLETWATTELKKSTPAPATTSKPAAPATGKSSASNQAAYLAEVSKKAAATGNAGLAKWAEVEKKKIKK